MPSVTGSLEHGPDELIIMTAPAYNDSEYMAILMAREVRDGEISACGALSQIPGAALLLAKETHAPNAEVILLNTVFRPFGTSRQFHFLCQRGELGLFFLSGVQIDRHANYNLHQLGADKAHPTARFPGGYGGGRQAVQRHHRVPELRPLPEGPQVIPPVRRQRHRVPGAADQPGLGFADDLDVALEGCEQDILSGAADTRKDEEFPIWDRIRRVLPPGAELSEFMAYLEPRIYRPGEYLVEQGGPPDKILFIEKGRVTVRLTLPDGRTMRLRSMTVGTMIGEIGMYLNQPRNASAIADEDTQAYVLSAEKLHEMEAKAPHLANALHHAIVALLAERLTATNGLLQRLID